MIASVTTTRYDDLRRIEAEVGTLIRRVKRVMGERAREVHPDLHPMTYFILSHLAQHGPLRAADLSDAFGMDKGGVSRQVQTLVDLGLVERQTGRRGPSRRSCWTPATRAAGGWRR